ncbi:hypothetical protein C0Q70_03644 [Pomacea canaliculata]|uniref:Orange domain-containing protein n=1 Tax=Pomacea canaliculata TaxID=400727 RepID=A0A2T7PTA5_POMCA|nr:hypothetical protein C0Q70_03644 [Pomacea canaliculata]
MTESECSSSSHVKDDARPYRKTNKPLMEKRRRTRINSCLVQLKALVLQAMKKDVSTAQEQNTQYSKLEKADILELTVKHLRHVQRTQIAADAVARYRAGFGECAQEVLRFIGGATVAEDVRERMAGHLTRCLASLTDQHLHHHYHQAHLQHLQQRGLVLLPHPAFPAPTPTTGQACLAGGVAGLVACSVTTLPSQVSQAGPNSLRDSHNSISLMSLATAPTAFQTPLSASTTNIATTTTSESLLVPGNGAPASLQVALLLTSSQTMPILTSNPTTSAETKKDCDDSEHDPIHVPVVLPAIAEPDPTPCGSPEEKQKLDDSPATRESDASLPVCRSVGRETPVPTPTRPEPPVSTTTGHQSPASPSRSPETSASNSRHNSLEVLASCVMSADEKMWRPW